jgi:hypothetical protein
MPLPLTGIYIVLQKDATDGGILLMCPSAQDLVYDILMPGMKRSKLEIKALDQGFGSRLQMKAKGMHTDEEESILQGEPDRSVLNHTICTLIGQRSMNDAKKKNVRKCTGPCLQRSAQNEKIKQDFEKSYQ